MRRKMASVCVFCVFRRDLRHVCVHIARRRANMRSFLVAVGARSISSSSCLINVRDRTALKINILCIRNVRPATACGRSLGECVRALRAVRAVSVLQCRAQCIC